MHLYDTEPPRQYRDADRVSGNLPAGVHILPTALDGDQPHVHVYDERYRRAGERRVYDGDWLIPTSRGNLEITIPRYPAAH